MEKDWRDRFGRFPEPVKNLITTNRLRVVASSRGFKWLKSARTSSCSSEMATIYFPRCKFPRLSSQHTKDRALPSHRASQNLIEFRIPHVFKLHKSNHHWNRHGFTCICASPS
ncbi:MAG: TRCF domain-containing protein [Akkermansiaceae bacterium]